MYAGRLTYSKSHRYSGTSLLPLPGLSGAGQNPSRPSVTAGQPHPSNYRVNVHAKTTLTEPARPGDGSYRKQGHECPERLTLKRVRGREKVSAGGQVEVPGFGHRSPHPSFVVSSRKRSHRAVNGDGVSQSLSRPGGGLPSTKSARENMDIVAAYQQVGTYRGAAAMCGTTHKTVRRIIERAEAGGKTPDRAGRSYKDTAT